MKKGIFVFAATLCIVAIHVADSIVSSPVSAEEPKYLKGQTVYLPIYSHIIVGETRKIPFNLSVNVSIRNTDPDDSIQVVAADYYDSQGKLVKHSLTKPVDLAPMASTYFLIKQSDTSGGWGANYLIEWKSENAVNEPIIESVTYGTRGTHSISFISRGEAIKEISK